MKGYVLHNFAKADSAWLEPLLGAIAAEAPLLAEGAIEKFQSRVAHAMQKVEIPQAPLARGKLSASRDARGEAPPLARRVKAN